MYKITKIISIGILSGFSLLSIGYGMLTIIRKAESSLVSPAVLGLFYMVVGVVTLVYCITLMRNSSAKESYDEVLDDDLSSEEK